MYRNLTIKRLFPLEKFGNIEITDEICEIPELASQNEDLMLKLTNLMLTEIQIKVNYYYSTISKTAGMTIQEAIVYLGNQKDEIQSSILEDKEPEIEVSKEMPTPL